MTIVFNLGGNEMDFLSFVKNARTCRRFAEDKPLQAKDLDWLIECARFTPSARNAQLVRFIEVLDEQCEKLFPFTHWAMALKDWKGPYEGERPTAFLALLLPEKSSSIAYIDLGIVAQTIQLAASSRGIGCCIIKSFDQEKTHALLSPQAPYTVELLLGLGVAVEKREAVDVEAGGDLTYWRNEEGVHFVPKRTQKELLLARLGE